MRGPSAMTCCMGLNPADARREKAMVGCWAKEKFGGEAKEEIVPDDEVMDVNERGVLGLPVEYHKPGDAYSDVGK
jgi:hypothetical protein